MSEAGGSAIVIPARKHECMPGWTVRTSYTGSGRVLDPPSASDYPKGTVWECKCGKTWVSRGPEAYHANIAGWRREGWLARWRRIRGQEKP